MRYTFANPPLIRALALVGAACLLTCGISSAQTLRKQVAEDGGTGPYKAEVVQESAAPRFTIYRPQDMEGAVAKEGRLPVIVYANGACYNHNVEMRYLLSEVASHGYVAIAIGPYDENDVVEQWKGVLRFSPPAGKDVVFANGEKLVPATKEEIEQRDAQFREAARRRSEEQAKAAKSKKAVQPAVQVQPQTYPRMLLEALDILTDLNANPSSEYYHLLDLGKVAAMGQSCGGAQVLAIAHDPRIRTCVMLNTGIGDMQMQGATKETLKELHTPMFYLIGGPSDIAYENAKKDFGRIEGLPVVMANTLDGHSGTYYESHGGPYSIAVVKWLDWQLKGCEGQSALFLDEEYEQMKFPSWSFVRKGFGRE